MSAFKILADPSEPPVIPELMKIKLFKIFKTLNNGPASSTKDLQEE
jgi:hypothetical protein